MCIRDSPGIAYRAIGFVDGPEIVWYGLSYIPDYDVCDPATGITTFSSQDTFSGYAKKTSECIIVNDSYSWDPLYFMCEQVSPDTWNCTYSADHCVEANQGPISTYAIHVQSGRDFNGNGSILHIVANGTNINIHNVTGVGSGYSIGCTHLSVTSPDWCTLSSIKTGICSTGLSSGVHIYNASGGICLLAANSLIENHTNGPIEVRGSGTLLRGYLYISEDDPKVCINGSNIRVENATIVNASTGIEIGNSNSIVLYNVTLINITHQDGIHIEDSHVVINHTFVNHMFNKTTSNEGPTGNGIFVAIDNDPTTYAAIDYSWINDSNNGVVAFGAAVNITNSNITSSSMAGVSLVASQSSLIEDNVIQSDGSAIALLSFITGGGTGTILYVKDNICLLYTSPSPRD